MQATTRRWTVSAIAVGFVAGVIALVAPIPIGASTTPSLTIAPTGGPAGTTIHVSGTGCPDPSWDTTLQWQVHVQILHGDSAATALIVTPPSGTPMTRIAFTAEGYNGRADATTTAASDGTWAVDVTIPASGYAPALPGTYPIGATCYATEGIEAGTISYPSQAFTVPPPPPPPTAPPAPPPPAPLPAPPGFTG